MQLDFTSASMLNDMVQSSVDAGRLYVFARYIPSSSVDAARRSQNIAFHEVCVVRGCSSTFCFTWMLREMQSFVDAVRLYIFACYIPWSFLYTRPQHQRISYASLFPFWANSVFIFGDAPAETYPRISGPFFIMKLIAFIWKRGQTWALFLSAVFGPGFIFLGGPCFVWICF